MTFVLACLTFLMVSWTEIKGKETTLKTIRIWQKVSVTEWLGRGLVIW